jgi:hypothetical protein
MKKRRPVAMVDQQNGLVVVCNDGSVLTLNHQSGQWSEMVAVPGTAADTDSDSTTT